MGLLSDATGVGAAAQAVEGTLSVFDRIIGRFFPDKSQAEKDAAAKDLQQMLLEGGWVQGQIDTNKIEAASASLFVAGWRPFVGWIGGVSLGLIYIPKALVLTGIWTAQAIVILQAWDHHGIVTLPPYPDLGLTDILGLLGSLLGFGTMRTFDKRAGVSGGH